MSYMSHAKRAEHVGMAVEAVTAGGKTDHRRARRKRARRAHLRILENDRPVDGSAKLARGMEIEIWRRLARSTCSAPL